MAQVRRHTRNPSLPPRRIPSLPDAAHLRPPLSGNTLRSQSFEVNDLSPYGGSPIRATYQQQIVNHSLPPLPPQTNGFYNSNHTKYDPLIGLLINPNTITTNSNENYEHSYMTSSSFNQVTARERQLPPPTPPPSSENIYSFQQRQHEQSRCSNNNNETDESVVIPTLDDDDDDGLPVVSITKNHLPVFARFPFDVTFLPQPMDTNIEDNVHKLRLRLIDSELNHQRRSTDDYIKRTQQLSLLPPKPTEHYVHNVRQPSNVTYRRVTPSILSRQTLYSPLSIKTPVTLDRIGMENNPQNNSDIEREFEIRRIQESINNGRQSNQQLIVPNYSHDPRLHLQPLNEDQLYSSSNMDDLIDSMARRHLAYRRLDANTDRQRHGNGSYVPYFDPVAIGRRASLRGQTRNEDVFFTNTTPTNLIEHDFTRTNPSDLNQMLLPRNDYYNLIQPDLNGLGMNNIIRGNSFSKLPPISPAIDSDRFNPIQNPSNSALYQAKHNPEGHRNYQRSVPLILPDNTEHLIDLPSDIFLTSRTEPVGLSPRHHRTRKTKPRPISKDKSDGSADSETDQSDDENNSSNRRRNRHKPKQEKKSDTGHHGFFTEGNSQQQQQQQQKKKKLHRRLFQKAAIGIYFINILKHRAAKTRLIRPNQTLSATIHKIRLQEIMVALHRVYLEPDGPIYNALIQTITSSVELKDALNSSSKYYSEAINVIGEALKNIISRIVDFMPRDGVLGTAKNSAVAALIQDGNPFPENYFWQCEKELLEFNKSKIINITKQRAMLLIIGIFIFRALVTTLLIKPIKYRLILGQLTNNQTASLKVLASVILYIGRRAAKSIPQILTLPHEWKPSLYSDADIEPIIQHSEIKSIITTCELSLRVWCEEYIRRIDASFGKQLRT